MAKKKILVIGSINTDMVVKSDRIPAPGETILGQQFYMFPGGKGANQAVAAARLGGNLSFIGKVGNDIFGSESIANLKHEGIDVSAVFVEEEQASGVALITVDSNGENSIVVAPGANHELLPEDILKAKDKIEQADIILLQLEIPVSTIDFIVGLAEELKKIIILNPAPALPLSHSTLSRISIIIPNENEVHQLTGVKVNGLVSAGEAAKNLHMMGAENVIITMGQAGAFILTEEFSGIVPADKVNAIDTTAAGDTFCGALAVAVSEGKSIKEAVGFANKAASISVTRMGAQASIPYREEIEKL